MYRQLKSTLILPHLKQDFWTPDLLAKFSSDSFVTVTYQGECDNALETKGLTQ